MKRLPVVFSFLLFLALFATLAYWIIQWIAPVPRAVSAPPKTERTMSPVSEAASLFGGRSSASTTENLQLRGLVHAGRASDSVAIITIEGKPPRAIKVNGEIVPGVTVKEILNKTVVVSEKGVERELNLPAFAAQQSNTTALPASMPPATNLSPTSPPAAMNTGNSVGASGSSGSQGSSSSQDLGMTPPPRPVSRP